MLKRIIYILKQVKRPQLLILLMLSARWVWALPTDPSHFMYPLDREYLLLSGLEDLIAAHLEKRPQDKIAVYVGSLHAPLLFDQKGQAQSQIQKLVEKFEVHNKQSLKVQSFAFKRANRNKFLEALYLVHSFSKDEDTMVLGRDALTYFDGILFIHNQD